MRSTSRSCAARWGLTPSPRRSRPAPSRPERQMRATRRELILRGGIAAGAVAAASALPASADAAAAAVPETDAELLARTLQIEQLLVFVYGRVLASNALDPSVAQQVRLLLGQERQHI